MSTVSREVKANGGRDAYRAHLAHQAAFEQARRPKTPKLACPRLAGQVAEWLEQWWSPEQIARLKEHLTRSATASIAAPEDDEEPYANRGG